MSIIYKAEEMTLCRFAARKLPQGLARRDRRKGAGMFPALMVVVYISSFLNLWYVLLKQLARTFRKEYSRSPAGPVCLGGCTVCVILAPV